MAIGLPARINRLALTAAPAPHTPMIGNRFNPKTFLGVRLTLTHLPLVLSVPEGNLL